MSDKFLEALMPVPYSARGELPKLVNYNKFRDVRFGLVRSNRGKGKTPSHKRDYEKNQ